MDIFAALTAAGEHLMRYGGHRQAAGLTLAREALEPFKAALEAYLQSNVPAETWVPALEYDLEVTLDALDVYAVAALEGLQPTGMGNPAPVFRARANAGKRAAHRPRRGAPERSGARRGRQAARRDVLRRRAPFAGEAANAICSFPPGSTSGRGA